MVVGAEKRVRKLRKRSNFEKTEVHEDYVLGPDPMYLPEMCIHCGADKGENENQSDYLPVWSFLGAAVVLMVSPQRFLLMQKPKVRLTYYFCSFCHEAFKKRNKIKYINGLGVFGLGLILLLTPFYKFSFVLFVLFFIFVCYVSYYQLPLYVLGEEGRKYSVGGIQKEFYRAYCQQKTAMVAEVPQKEYVKPKKGDIEPLDF